jgi:hypothetical protein
VAGLEVVSVVRTTSDKGLNREELDRAWAWLSDEDLSTEGAYVIAQKPMEIKA